MAKLHTPPSASHGKATGEADHERPVIVFGGEGFVLYPVSFGRKYSKPLEELKRDELWAALHSANNTIVEVLTSLLRGRLSESVSAESQTSEPGDTNETDRSTSLLLQQLQRLREEQRFEDIFDIVTARSIANAVLLEEGMLSDDPASSETFARRVRTLDRDSVPTDALTQQMIDDAPVRQLDPRREAMRKATVEAVLTNAEWMSAAQVSDSINPRAKNKHAIASRLLKDQRVFALVHQGEYVFPRYAFDAAGQPLPVIRDVLQIGRAHV